MTREIHKKRTVRTSSFDDLRISFERVGHCTTGILGKVKGEGLDDTVTNSAELTITIKYYLIRCLCTQYKFYYETMFRGKTHDQDDLIGLGSFDPSQIPDTLQIDAGVQVELPDWIRAYYNMGRS